MLGEHILAWHKLRETNVLLFEHDMANDGLSKRYWYNEDYANNQICGLLFTKFAYAGHYDYVLIMEEEAPDQFQYQPQGNRNIDIIL